MQQNAVLDRIEWQINDPEKAIALLREHWSIEGVHLKKPIGGSNHLWNRGFHPKTVWEGM